MPPFAQFKISMGGRLTVSKFRLDCLTVGRQRVIWMIGGHVVHVDENENFMPSWVIVVPMKSSSASPIPSIN